MRNKKPWLDINPLIKVCPGIAAPKLEVPECLSSALCSLPLRVPQMPSPPILIFAIPVGISLRQHFSELDSQIAASQSDHDLHA
jgi:hypothetical protein